MKLWRYNNITGYWDYVRDVTEETKKQWTVIFQKDEPNAIFKVSKSKPKTI
ncbi:MAG: hypothetical protein ACQEXX_01765 [Bacillota bacterium]